MKIADVRVIQADIPVVRPHKMSFTTLEAMNFVFVRLEDRGRSRGLGRGRVPRRPDLERGILGIGRCDDRALPRAGVDRPGCDGDRGARTRHGSPSARQSLRACRGGDGALGSQRTRPRRSGASPPGRPRAGPCAALVVARRRRSRRGGRRGAGQGLARPSHLQDQDGGAAGCGGRRSASGGFARRWARPSRCAWTPIRGGIGRRR